jgi:protein arginine kinase
MASAMVRALPPEWPFDAVSFVPSTLAAYRYRGFDHAQLIAQEMRARETVLSNIEVEDKIHRALGILKTAMLIDHNEAMSLLSLVRLGVSSKKLETLSTDSIDKLIVEVQPASIMTRSGDDLSPRDRDIKRAEMIRKRFQ